MAIHRDSSVRASMKISHEASRFAQTLSIAQICAILAKSNDHALAPPISHQPTNMGHGSEGVFLGSKRNILIKRQLATQITGDNREGCANRLLSSHKD